MRFGWFTDHASDTASDDPQVKVDDIIARVLAEHRAAERAALHPDDRPAEPDSAPQAQHGPSPRPRPVMAVALGFSHEAPTWALSPAEAHRLMQQHRHCTVADCARKRAAWSALVEAGKIRPDSCRLG